MGSQKRIPHEPTIDNCSYKKQRYGPSPNLFSSDDDETDNIQNAQNENQQKLNDDQCDDNDSMMQNHSVSVENTLSNVQVTPANPFIESVDFHSEPINIREIIDALVSQTPQIDRQQQLSLQQQEPEPELVATLQQQQQQLASEVAANLLKPVDELIDEFTSSSDRINKLVGDLKETS